MLTKTRSYYLTIACMLAFISAASAQQTGPVSYLDIANGLSNNDITSIYRDEEGFMWFGSYDGLNRYDAYGFRTFKKRLGDSTSIVNNKIAAISEDCHNNLWVGTKSGTCIYHKCIATFSQLYYTPYGKKDLVKDSFAVNDIKRDHKGNMLVGSGGKGLLFVPQGETHARQLPCIVGNDKWNNYHVESIEMAGKDSVWLFVQGAGLCLLDYNAGLIRQVNGSIGYGSCIKYDLAGQLWVGTFWGLFKYDIKNNSYASTSDLKLQLSNDKITALCFDRTGRLWVATDGGGISIIDTRSNSVSYLGSGQYRKLLASSSVFALYQDRQDRMWIGTLRGGVNIIDPQKSRIQTIAHDPLNANSLINNFALSFCEEPSGNLWIGTDGYGVSYWDRSKNVFTNFKNIPGDPNSLTCNFATSITRDYTGITWIGTYGGSLCRYDPVRHTFKKYYCSARPGFHSPFIWTIYEDSKKELWVGTIENGCLFHYNRQLDRFELFDWDIANILRLYEDREGTLWAGTYNELIRIDREKKHHRHFKLNNAVRSIHEDASGNFWIGTEGDGLLQFDRTRNTFTAAYTEADGLSNNAILNILEDKKHNLWLSTFYGISKFSIPDKKVRNYFESDGLQSNQLNYNAAMISQKGEFLFGGLKGFNIFYPDSLQPQPQNLVPPLQITGVKINNRSVERPPDITIPYDQAVLSIDYSALEYTAPDKISYSYYLEGWDKDWINAGKGRNANYSHLNEGHYTFHLRSTNAEDEWSTLEKTMRITILPPWYRTWWAYTIYLGILALCIYYYRLYRTRRQELKYEVRLTQIKAEKDKELNEKKLAFFTDITHEFRTLLTLIVNPVKDLLHSKKEDPQNAELSIVYRNAKRLLGLSDQLLLFRKADSGADQLRITRLDFTALCHDVCSCFSQHAKSKQLKYEFFPDKDNPSPLWIYADREKIEIALFNLISNACKYAPLGGIVSVSVSGTPDWAAVTVSDNGPGVPAGKQDRLFQKYYQVEDSGTKAGFGIGLYLVHAFAILHKGNIEYKGSADHGAVFTLSLRTGSDHFDKACLVDDPSPVDTAENPVAFLEELTPGEETDASAMPEADPLDDLVSTQPSMLIVDDNDQIREYIAQIFKKEYILHEAPNGQIALQLSRKFVPDIIISDVVMDGGDGIDFCSSLKQDPSLRHIPIILLTASASADTKLKGIELGADDYINKPFDKDLLVAKVQSLLKNRNHLQQYFLNEITLKPNDGKVSEEYRDFLERCMAIVEDNIDNEDFNIKMLATEIGMSHSNLYKKVKAVSGQSVNAFIRFIRLRKAALLLINSNCNINEAAFMAGIADPKYFRRQFSRLFGMTPSDYIKKYRKPFQKQYSLNEKIGR